MYLWTLPQLGVAYMACFAVSDACSPTVEAHHLRTPRRPLAVTSCDGTSARLQATAGWSGRSVSCLPFSVAAHPYAPKSKCFQKKVPF